jgi:hypothetical protein
MQTSAEICWVANCDFREGRRSEGANIRALGTVNKFLFLFHMLIFPIFFDVSTSYSSFRWGAAGEKCDVTV